MLLVSITVKYNDWGRMGNRMFQYSFGYILAKQKNVEIYHEGIPNFNISPNQDPNKVNTELLIYTHSYGNNKVNMKNLLQTDNDIIIDSYLQHAEYYIPHVAELRNIYNVNKTKIINKDKIVIHIRETDYADINCFPGFEFYLKLLNNFKFTDVIIVTDNTYCETVKKLVQLGCQLNTEGKVDKFDTICNDRGMFDFYTLMYSENIILSHSTFAWWAAFLGNHKRIIFPYSMAYKQMWNITPKNDDDINLFFDFGYSEKLIV